MRISDWSSDVCFFRSLWSVLAAAFLILGVTALQALRRRLDEGERCAFKTALVAAVAASLLQWPVLDGAGRVTAENQPAKAAAEAGYRGSWCDSTGDGRGG